MPSKATMITLALLASLTLGKIVLDLSQSPKMRHDSPIELPIGSTFEIVLRENPSTGHKWYVADTDLEASGLSSVIKQSDTRYV